MKIFFICTLLIFGHVFAEEIKMNDIALSDYGDFTKKWNLVTVRYRQDSHEMRFTYANEKAWNALTKGVLPFPEGSVFAKIGFKSGVDPAFTSSIVPSGARRFQFMVKNLKKYPDTDGWGYGLFDSDGGLFPGEVKTVTNSCHACHKLVPERDFVFSEAIEFSPLIKKVHETYTIEKNKGHLRFATIQKKEFINRLKLYFNGIKMNSISYIDGDIRNFFFGGTLDEVTPALIKHAFDTKTPSGFISLDQNTFKVLALKEPAVGCAADEYAFLVYEYRSEWADTKKLESKSLCYSKNNL